MKINKSIVLGAIIISTIVLVILVITVSQLRRKPQPRVNNPELLSEQQQNETLKALPKTTQLNTVPNQTFQSDAKKSEQAVSELLPSLPYTQTVKTSTGGTVDIMITKPIDDRTITVQMNNLDFQVPTDDPLYPSTKKNFQEAAKYTISWLQQKGVNLSNIYIYWGTRDFENQRAQQWINELPTTP